MENNNMENNTGVIAKKNNNIWVFVIIAILIGIIVALIMIRMKKPSLSPSDMELNRATQLDTTASINSSLDNITIEDTSSADLQEVDKELETL